MRYLFQVNAANSAQSNCYRQKKPSILNSSIEHVSIPPMDLMGYSKFMLQDLYKFVDTKFCLVIQSDGFVINPNLWTNQFLEYDYIGAPWPNEISVYNASINKIDLKKIGLAIGGFPCEVRDF